MPAVLGGGVAVGAPVFAVGHPLGLVDSLSAGVVSALDRTVSVDGNRKLEHLIQIDAAVNPGNSGGPLLNKAGQVVGIVTGLANPTDQSLFVGIGFAVPIATAGGARGQPAPLRRPIGPDRATTRHARHDRHREHTDDQEDGMDGDAPTGRHALEQALYEVKRTIVGQDVLLERMLVALLARGHLLVEGVPGLAKTMAIKTLAQAIGGEFQRIQFTPDLVPADLVGTRIYNQKDGEFQVSLGPVFANLVLADEINRAPAKVQSALLEVMQERQVTIGRETFPAPDPFLVMATQNPIESEGTYALPEAQVDRFMLKVLIGYPSAAEEFVVVERQIAAAVATVEGARPGDAARLPARGRRRSTSTPRSSSMPSGWPPRPASPASVGPADLARLLTYGASPRASINLVLAARALAFLRGRDYALPDRRARPRPRRAAAPDRAVLRGAGRGPVARRPADADPRGRAGADGAAARAGRSGFERVRVPAWCSPAVTRHGRDRPAERRAPAPAPRVAGRAAARRPAPGRLPQPLPRVAGSTSPTCASTCRVTTCATSSGTSRRGSTSPTCASTSRTASSRRGCCSTTRRRWGSDRSTGRRTSCSPRWRRRSRTC